MQWFACSGGPSSYCGVRVVASLNGLNILIRAGNFNILLFYLFFFNSCDFMWVMQRTADKSVAECPWSPVGGGAGGSMTQCENKNTNKEVTLKRKTHGLFCHL